MALFAYLMQNLLSSWLCYQLLTKLCITMTGNLTCENTISELLPHYII